MCRHLPDVPYLIISGLSYYVYHKKGCSVKLQRTYYSTLAWITVMLSDTLNILCPSWGGTWLNKHLTSSYFLKNNGFQRAIFHHAEPDKHGISACLGQKRSSFISRFWKRERDGQGAHHKQPSFFSPPLASLLFFLVFIAFFSSSLSNLSLFLLLLSCSFRLIYFLPCPSALNLLDFFYQAVSAARVW